MKPIPKTADSMIMEYSMYLNMRSSNTIKLFLLKNTAGCISRKPLAGEKPPSLQRLRNVIPTEQGYRIKSLCSGFILEIKVKAVEIVGQLKT